MADPELLKLIRQGVTEWNNYRVQNYAAKELDLRGADLSHADLWRFDLNNVNLSGANLEHADLNQAILLSAKLTSARMFRAQLREVNLTRAELIGADLSSAELVFANLTDADLTDANLAGAMLAKANLTGADLSRAKLTKVDLFGTIFGRTLLKDAKALETCLHHGVSIIDFQTLAWSGNLPLSFLRGVGLTDKIIEYLPSLLIEQAMQFESCFISYSTYDDDFANRLHADLQNQGVRCWFAPHDMRGGKKLHEQIDAAIQVHDRLLLLLSEASMNSEWVKTEIAKARKREVREKRRMLFPVRLVDFETLEQWECFHADTGKDSAREIREYFVPDFSNWKNHDSYQMAFDRLLKDLKSAK